MCLSLYLFVLIVSLKPLTLCTPKNKSKPTSVPTKGGLRGLSWFSIKDRPPMNRPQVRLVSSMVSVLTDPILVTYLIVLVGFYGVTTSTKNTLRSVVLVYRSIGDKSKSWLMRRVGIDPFFVVQRPSPKGGGFLFEKSSSGHPGRKICLEKVE